MIRLENDPSSFDQVQVNVVLEKLARKRATGGEGEQEMEVGTKEIAVVLKRPIFCIRLSKAPRDNLGTEFCDRSLDHHRADVEAFSKDRVYSQCRGNYDVLAKLWIVETSELTKEGIENQVERFVQRNGSEAVKLD